MLIFTIILFLLILSFLVFIHELGHFYFARKFGVYVEEFGIGIPPRAWGKKVGDTIYSINWLPLGGFVKIKGEDFTPDYNKDDPTNFINKKPWKRIVILIAGVVMNAMLGILIFYFTLGMNGWKSSPLMLMNDYSFKYGQKEDIPNVITFIEQDSAAYVAGMQFADQVLSLSHNEETLMINDSADIKTFLSDKENEAIQVNTFNITTREFNTYDVTPKFSESIQQPGLGIGMDDAFMLVYTEPLDTALAGPMHSLNVIGYSLSIFKDLFQYSVETGDVGPVSQGVAGPVGIFGAVQSIIGSGADNVWLSVLDLIALLSLSLALMNLLPIPALDGGRIVFVLVEWISGKRPSPKLEARAHQIGYVSLLLLLVVITFKDIIQLF